MVVFAGNSIAMDGRLELKIAGIHHFAIAMGRHPVILMPLILSWPRFGDFLEVRPSFVYEEPRGVPTGGHGLSFAQLIVLKPRISPTTIRGLASTDLFLIAW
jgi:hypothetical protein